MKKRYVIIFAACVALAIGSFAAGKYFNGTNSNKNISKNDTNVKISTSKSKLDILDQRSEKAWEKIQSLAKQEGIAAIQAKDNGSYNIKQPIRLSKNFYVILENAKTTTVPATGSNYVIADVTISNISTKDYYNDLSNFSLQDESGYTYEPDTSYNVTGNIEGNVPKDKGMRRGQIAFKVANAQTNFVLTFSPKNLPENSYNIQSINFKLYSSN